MSDHPSRSGNPPEDGLTWAALLAGWTEFAKAAIALPAGDAGDRWRAIVPDVIGLHAVTCALGDIGRLSAARRAAGVDMAAVLIRRHAAAIHAAWASEPLPARLAELIGDARAALDSAAHLGWEWTVSADRLIVENSDALVTAALGAGARGPIYAVLDGTVLFRGSPAVFVTGDPPPLPQGDPPGLARSPVPVPPRQIYRQIDEMGRATRDLVAPLLTMLPPGRPLLRLAADAGRRTPDPAGADRWRDEQRAMLGERTLPVVFEDDAGERTPNDP